MTAIKSVLAEDGITIKTDSFLLTSLTRACRIRNDRIITRLPIYKHLLHRILDELVKWADKEHQSYMKTLYLALFAAAYYGLLRIGEVTKSPHAILANNVNIGTNKNKILFLLKSSKTHDEGSNPQRIKISSTAKNPERHSYQKNQKYCPFTLLDSYINKMPHALSETE